MARITKITQPEFVSKVPPSQNIVNARRAMEMGPDIYQQARGLWKAGVAHAKSGFRHVRRETYDTRLAVCQACPHWQPDAWAGMGKCKQCGCSGIKLTWATSMCPLAKWGMEANPQ